MSENQATLTLTPEEVEGWVLDTCRGLGLRADDADRDFFAIGGTSMTAIRLIASAEERFGEDALTAEDLYECTSLRDIAKSIGGAGQPESTDPT
jgi:hypothetical protein